MKYISAVAAWGAVILALLASYGGPDENHQLACAGIFAVAAVAFAILSLRRWP